MSTIKAKNKEFIEMTQQAITQNTLQKKCHRNKKTICEDKDTMLNHYRQNKQTTLEVEAIKIYRVNKRNNNEKLNKKATIFFYYIIKTEITLL